MNPYYKNIFRMILSNKRRYFAILIIVMLGASFFAGLRSTAPDMRASIDEYFDNYHVFDIRILTNYGLTEEIISEIGKISTVDTIEPAFYADEFVKVGETAFLVRFHSLSTNMNAPKIIEGKLPENPNECVVGVRMFDEMGFKIGDKISVYTGNDDSIFDDLRYDTYTITASVQSPLYVAPRYGNTNKGKGAIDGFFLIPPEAFASDIYTEAYISLSNAATLSRFSDEYEQLRDNMKDVVDDSLLPLTTARKETLTNDALVELNDARAEIADAKQKLNDAYIELLDGEASYNDALLEFKDGEKKLADGKAELLSKKEELEDGERQLLEGEETFYNEIALNEKKLSDGEAELSSFAALLAESRQQLEGAKLMLGEETFAELYGAQEAELNASIAILDERTDELSYGRTELATQKARTEAEIAEKRQELEDGKIKLSEAEAEIAEKELELEDGRKELEDAKKELDDGFVEYFDEKAKADIEIADAEREIYDGQKKIDEMEDPKTYVLGLDANIGFVSFAGDSDRIGNIAKVFPAIFFLVAALVCMTNMLRIVEDEQMTAGTLKAMGFSSMSIFSKYLFYALSVSFPGAIIGLLIGYQLFPWLIYNKGYAIMYDMSYFITPLFTDIALMTVAIALISVLIPTIYVAVRQSFANPAALMRPPSPAAGKRVLLERIPFIWKHMGFFSKVTTRNILRYKKRFFMTTIGIAGCCALILTGFGIYDSIRTVGQTQFSKLFIYDFQIDLKEKADYSALNLQSFDIITNSTPVYKNSLTAKANNTEYSVNITVPSDISTLDNYIRFYDTKTNKPLTLDNSGAIISKKLSDETNVKEGAYLTIISNNTEYSLKVAGITENYVYHQVYLSPAQYSSIFNEPAINNTILAKLSTDDPAAEEQLSKNLLSYDAVSALSFNHTSKDYYDDLIKSLSFVIIVLIIAAAALAFIVLISLTGINIDERAREISTLKTLGFFDNETSSYVLRENIVLTIIGTAMGLFLGIFLHRYVITTAEVDMVTFGRNVEPLSYTLSAALTCLFSAIVAFIMSFVIKKQDMLESLKSVE